MSTRTVPVPLPAGAYAAVIGAGLLGEMRERVGTACPAARYAVIADDTVADLYGHRVAAALDATLHTFPAGEAAKSRSTWSTLTDELLAAGLGRDGAIVALGGGVTGDIAGFVAATYLRGVPLVQAPTTVLAMVDSAIGGKTGVDAPAGKNLVGAFHQPHLVLADVLTIGSLPVPARRAGLIEALKHGAIADAEYFARLHASAEDLLAADPDALIDAIARSVAIKAAIVADDEREAGRRAILNAGHTVAHALEHASGFRLSHGEAVGMGLVAEAAIGERLGLTEPGTSAALSSALQRLGAPTAAPALPASAIRDALAVEKKNRAGAVRIAPLRRIGEAYQTETEEWTVEADPDLVLAVIGGK